MIMKYFSIFFKSMSQYSDEFEDIKDLEDLDLVISRTSYFLNQNNNNEIDMQYNDNLFSHIDLFKIFNKIYKELKYQYLIIQNLNISLITLKYHNFRLIFQQFSHELK